MLSTARAEATRAASMLQAFVERFARIEASRSRAFVSGDRYDPRNRRMSIVLAWRATPQQAGARTMAGGR
jgi:chemotaxis protein MotB